MVGGSYLMNYLYRASGPVFQGSLALIAESLFRFPLMIGLLKWLGLPGIPLAGILTSIAFVFLAYRWSVRRLSVFAKPVKGFSWAVWVVRGMILGSGMVLCCILYKPSWLNVVVMGSMIACIGGFILLLIDPSLGEVRKQLRSIPFRFKVVQG